MIPYMPMKQAMAMTTRLRARLPDFFFLGVQLESGAIPVANSAFFRLIQITAINRAPLPLALQSEQFV